MSGFQTDLLTGLAADLNTAAIATWKSSGVYASTETGIVLGAVPQEPDRIVTLTAYPVSDDPSLSDSVMGVQVRCRWSGQDPRPVDDLQDEIFNHWHARQHFELSTGVYVVLCLRQSGPVSLGQDANNRWSTSANYYLTVHRPSTRRT